MNPNYHKVFPRLTVKWQRLSGKGIGNPNLPLLVMSHHTETETA